MNKLTRLQKRQVSAVGVRRWRVANRPEQRAQLPNLSVVRLVARNRLRPGVIVWARVPFEDDVQYKIRPAVVLDCRGRTVVILACTSSPARHRRMDRPVELWDVEAARLRRPTAVRRMALSIDHVDVLDVIGELSGTDWDRVLGAAVVSRLGA
ncbi:type II toxin-antitoxin system PemK/MazF family toxin [Micromonospora sp. NBC_00860]|uniref:type II toxin-antitoxin system PemK/MazF family toxin n=1 Tax=Micromonospora sp. NBC_00860 TaxID=2975980 RepID=UPI00386D5ABC|nr:hypothetical protein OH804_22710 [Micromonospora sp. NBC_00860]WTA68777.1 hypothetical protein OHB51_06345 [Micromonospora sp. NBC_00855]